MYLNDAFLGLRIRLFIRYKTIWDDKGLRKLALIEIKIRSLKRLYVLVNVL